VPSDLIRSQQQQQQQHSRKSALGCAFLRRRQQQQQRRWWREEQRMWQPPAIPGTMQAATAGDWRHVVDDSPLFFSQLHGLQHVSINVHLHLLGTSGRHLRAATPCLPACQA